MAEAIGARAPVRARRFRGEVYARHASDALRLALGGLVVALATRAVHPDRVGRQETNVFRLVNDLPLPGWAYPFIWFMMQLGNLGAVPLVAVAAAATRRWRLALDAAVAGGAIYVVARLIKQFVQRGRPQTLLDGVHILGEPARGLGYVSGHSATSRSARRGAGRRSPPCDGPSTGTGSTRSTSSRSSPSPGARPAIAPPAGTGRTCSS